MKKSRVVGEKQSDWVSQRSVITWLRNVYLWMKMSLFVIFSFSSSPFFLSFSFLSYRSLFTTFEWRGPMSSYQQFIYSYSRRERANENEKMPAFFYHIYQRISHPKVREKKSCRTYIATLNFDWIEDQQERRHVYIVICVCVIIICYGEKKWFYKSVKTDSTIPFAIDPSLLQPYFDLYPLLESQKN